MTIIHNRRMALEFPAFLSRARREAGFRSAYQFFHTNGGRRHFRFTYVHYLRLENSGRLPRPEWMPRIVSALRLGPGADGARRFFEAYLRDLLGAEGFETVAQPLLCRHPGPPLAAGAEGLRWMKSAQAVHMTPAQFHAIAADEAVYWCSEILLSDEAAWTAEALAQRLGLPLKGVRAALPRLAAAGLARQMSGGRWKSRHPGKFFTFPGRLEGMAPAFSRVQGFWEAMYRKVGREENARVELVRAESSFIKRYAQTFNETVDAANLGNVSVAGEDTALYLIEARVRRLLPL